MVRYLVILFSLIFTFEFSASAAIQPSATPAFYFCDASDAKGYGGPGIVATDITKFYAVTCGFGTSNVTAGNYYKCRKQGGAAGDWSVASTKVAYCPCHYAQTNSTANTAYSFGYGTAATAGNTSSGPTGDNSYATTGTGFSWGQASSNETAKPVRIPVKFDATVPAATIYPYIRVDGAATQSLNVNLICTDI